MRSTQGFIVPLAAALVGAMVAPVGAGAPSPKKCEQTIARAAGAFFIQHTAVVRKCEKRRAQGVLAPDVDCTLDAPMAGELSLLAAELQRSIGKACGGPDGSCGTPDDLSLAETGWHDVAKCPDIDGSGCSGPIADCGNVADCVQCVGEAASEQTRGVVADDFDPDEFGTDSDANKCQVALLKGSTKFMQIATKALGKCWTARLQGKADGDCPEDDKETAGLLARAEEKKLRFICEACGGDDEACGGGDDVSPEAIGFGSDCPDLSVPSGDSCGGAILGLEDVVACVDCVAAFKAECVTRLAAPGAADYPPDCNPSGGDLCGNGVLDPGEECDPAAGSPDGAFEGSPGGAFCSEGRTCTAACVCVGGTTTSTTITKTTTSTTTTTRPSKKKCGNGKLDKWEKCDASAPSGLKRCKPDDGCHPKKCECVDDGGKTTTTTTLPPGSTTTTTTSPPASTTTTTTSPPASTTTTTTLPPGSPSGAFM